MTHEEIERGEIVDAYVRGRLTDAEKLSFEEHFFACPDCFQLVRDTQRLSEGVRHAVGAGLLPEVADAQTIATWYRPAFAFSAVAACVLLAVTGWLAAVRLPQLESEANDAQARIQEQQRANAALQQRVRQQEVRARLLAGNLPLAMLESSRGVGANRIKIYAGAPVVALWMEVGPASYMSFKLEIADMSRKVIDEIAGLTKNSYGAVAASIPAAGLVPGSYSVRLFGFAGARTTLVGEYRLEVVR